MAISSLPRNYFGQEFPLPHNFGFAFELFIEDETKNSTIIPIIRQSELAFDIEGVEVNPSHANFAEETGATVAPKSIIPKINFSMNIAMSKISYVTDLTPAMRVSFMPIYTAFEESLTAKDEKTAVEVEDILELTHGTTDKEVVPLYSAADVSGLMPLGTVVDPNEAFGDWGLTGNANLESVAFDTELFFDALHYYSNSGMLKKSIGRWTTVTILKDRPFFFSSNNFTLPMIKRANPYTFCGMLVHVPQSDSFDQLTRVGDTTAAGAGVNVQCRIRYDEWNPNFDQTAVA